MTSLAAATGVLAAASVALIALPMDRHVPDEQGRNPVRVLTREDTPTILNAAFIEETVFMGEWDFSTHPLGMRLTARGDGAGISFASQDTVYWLAVDASMEVIEGEGFWAIGPAHSYWPVAQSGYTSRRCDGDFTLYNWDFVRRVDPDGDCWGSVEFRGSCSLWSCNRRNEERCSVDVETTTGVEHHAGFSCGAGGWVEVCPGSGGTVKVCEE